MDEDTSFNWRLPARLDALRRDAEKFGFVEPIICLNAIGGDQPSLFV